MMSLVKVLLGACQRIVFKARYALRARSWPLAVTQQAPDLHPTASLSGLVVVVSGFFNEALGIGRAGRLVADRLAELGANVVREDLRPFDRGLATRPIFPFPQGKTAKIWLLAVNPPEARLAFYSHDPEIWRDLYRIGLWHWESSVAPADWVELTAYFHEIWASSRFTAEALSTAMHLFGREQDISKIRILPLPVEIPLETPEHMGTCVRVLTLFDPRSDFERKNPMAVIDVWLSLFPQVSMSAKLIVKTHTDAVHHPRFAELIARAQNRPDIEVMARTLNGPETDRLIGDTDILISLHRGEGFGLPLAEAMAAGVSVIATGWSGNMQFMTSENSVPLPYRLVPANNAYNGPRAQWADPDLDAAGQGLKQLIDDPALRKRLGAQARSDMIALRENWTPFAPQTVHNPCNPV